ncbi:MAG: hypothetical protein WCC27_02925 [Acidobacteriaceae bacterium]
MMSEKEVAAKLLLDAAALARITQKLLDAHTPANARTVIPEAAKIMTKLSSMEPSSLMNVDNAGDDEVMVLRSQLVLTFTEMVGQMTNVAEGLAKH